MISVLSIYRGAISSNRGTSIRVRQLFQTLGNRGEIDFYVASWDKNVEFPVKKHIHLLNNHLKELLSLIRFIRNNNIDVVIGHTISSVYYMIPIKMFTPAKIVLEMHGFLEEEEYEYGSIGRLSFWFKKLLFNNSYRFFDSITTCSLTAQKYIEKYNRSVITIYGGVDTILFYNRPTEPHRDIVIGYAGNARIWQGLRFLLNTLDEYVSVHKDVRLKVLCSEERWKLPKEFKHFAEQVGPLPYNKVPSFLSQCDILVIPRPNTRVNYLSFPSKLMEYMAMGKAVLASNTSDCHNIIRSGVNGFLYEPENKIDFMEKLTFLRDSSLREKIGYNASNDMSNFTWSQQGDKLVEQIQYICQKKTGN